MGGEEGLAQAVGRRRPGEAGEHQRGIVGRGGVELSQGRHAVLGQLARRPAAHGGDPLAGRDRGSAGGDHRLHLGDRGCVLQPRVVPGTVAEQDDVVVVVDQAGDHRAALHVDHPGAGPDLGVGDEPSLADARRGYHRVMGVHGVDAAVHDPEVACSGATGGGSLGLRRQGGHPQRRGPGQDRPVLRLHAGSPAPEATA